MNTKTVGGSVTNPQIQTGVAGQAGALQKARDADKANSSSSTANGASARSGVNVNVSPQARELLEARQKALDIARATPEVREERIAELKKRIQDGSYNVDAGNIADGLLREAIKDRLSSTAE